MADKEEKAIERCKQLIKVEHANWIGMSNQDAIGIVLGLVEKLHEETEKYKYLYQKALNNTIKADRELLNKKAEIEKKDKIIDEMAKYWQSGLSYCEDCDRIIEDYDSQRCETCIKEYFKNKVNSSEQN